MPGTKTYVFGTLKHVSIRAHNSEWRSTYDTRLISYNVQHPFFSLLYCCYFAAAFCIAWLTACITLQLLSTPPAHPVYDGGDTLSFSMSLIDVNFTNTTWYCYRCSLRTNSQPPCRFVRPTHWCIHSRCFLSSVVASWCNNVKLTHDGFFLIHTSQSIIIGNEEDCNG